MTCALKRQRAMLAAEKLARARREIADMWALEKEADELRLKGKLERGNEMKAMAIDGSIQEFDVGEEKAKDLIAIDPESMDLQPYDLFQTGGTEDLISRIEEEARSVLPDVSTPKGRKAVASNAAKVARSKTYIDGLGKDLVARLKRQSKLIDEERRRMRSRLNELKTEVRQPLTDFENREKDRVARLQVRVAESFAIHVHDSSSLEAIDAQIANITAVPIDDTWEEYKYTATMAQRWALVELAAARNEELKLSLIHISEPTRPY